MEGVGVFVEEGEAKALREGAEEGEGGAEAAAEVEGAEETEALALTLGVFVRVCEALAVKVAASEVVRDPEGSADCVEEELREMAEEREKQAEMVGVGCAEAVSAAGREKVEEREREGVAKDDCVPLVLPPPPLAAVGVTAGEAVLAPRVPETVGLPRLVALPVAVAVLAFPCTPAAVAVAPPSAAVVGVPTAVDTAESTAEMVNVAMLWSVVVREAVATALAESVKVRDCAALGVDAGEALPPLPPLALGEALEEGTKEGVGMAV